MGHLKMASNKARSGKKKEKKTAGEKKKKVVKQGGRENFNHAGLQRNAKPKKTP